MNVGRRASLWVMAVMALLAGGVAGAQPYGRPPGLRGVGIDQKLNSQAPLDLRFNDESGRQVSLGSLFRGKPVVLSLVYYKCPMLCNLVLNAELRGFRQIPLELGKDFDAVTVSFDARETSQIAREKKAGYIEKYNRGDANAGWHFLTGNEDQIGALADAVGFRYRWDETTNQWAHASAIVILTAEGKIARYLYGVEYSRKDLRFALVEASKGKIGTPADQILLFCYHYDPSTGKYTFAIMNALRAGGSATLLALGLFLFVSLRRERKPGALNAR